MLSDIKLLTSGLVWAVVLVVVALVVVVIVVVLVVEMVVGDCMALSSLGSEMVGFLVRF